MRHAALALVLFASACGAKSELPLPGSGGRSGAAGVGGSGAVAGSGGVAGTGGASGSGGASGIGGAPPWATGTTCTGFVDRGSRSIDEGAWRDEQPALVLSSADLSRATLAFERMPTASGVVTLELGQVDFAAWGDWPGAPLGQASTLYKDGGYTFRLSRAVGGGFAVLAERFSAGLAVGIALATSVTPGQPMDNPVALGVAQDQPAFLARGESDHLYGYTTGGSGSHLLLTARAPDNGRPVLPGTGCASDAIHADAVRMPGHYLVATSSSRPFGTCLNAGDGSNPADRFQVAVVPDSGQASLAWEWNDAVDDLALVPRSDGAWVVWQAKPNVTVAPIFAARLDTDGNLLTLPNAFGKQSAALAGFAVDRVADDLALAWVDVNVPSGPTIHVQLFDQDAVNDPHLDFAIQPAPPQWPTGPLSLLGSPDGQHLLVSWEAQDADGQSVVVTRRLDCVAPQ